MLTDATSIMGDVSLFTSFLLIIASIEKNKSAAGWSGRMQILFMFVFVTRYWNYIENFRTIYSALKGLLWIILSAYVMYTIYIKYRKTFERDYDKLWIEVILLPCFALAFLFCEDVTAPEEISYLFSYYVESMTILPQYYFIFIKMQKELIVTYYVVSLVYYKMFYVGHWIYIYVSKNLFYPSVVYPGIVQLVLYAIYFLLPRGKKTVEPPVVQSNMRTYITQLSLLETPLLKRSATATSIYLIGEDSSYSTLTRSVKSFDSSKSTTSEDSQSEDSGRY